MLAVPKAKKNLAPDNIAIYQYAIKVMLALYSGKPATEFGIAQLKTVRAQLVESGLRRGVVNQRTNKIKTILRWGGSEGIIPPSVYHNVQCLIGLRRGETSAPESKTRKDIPEDVIEKTIAELSPTLVAAVRVQLANAARPSEVLKMRIENIDRTNPDLWTVSIPEHKNSWREGSDDKILYLALSEQAIIAPLIGDRTEGYVFRPEQAIAEQKVAKWTKAKYKKKSPSRKARDKARAAKRKNKPAVNECYDVAAYRRAITRACKRAGVQHWYPYGIRHTGITLIGTEHGIEAAQHVAGHKNLKITQGYFHGGDKIAMNIALKRNEPAPQPAASTPQQDTRILELLAEQNKMQQQQIAMLTAVLQKQGIESLENQTVVR